MVPAALELLVTPAARHSICGAASCPQHASINAHFHMSFTEQLADCHLCALCSLGHDTHHLPPSLCKSYHPFRPDSNATVPLSLSNSPNSPVPLYPWAVVLPISKLLLRLKCVFYFTFSRMAPSCFSLVYLVPPLDCMFLKSMLYLGRPGGSVGYLAFGNYWLQVVNWWVWLIRKWELNVFVSDLLFWQDSSL